MKTLILSSSLSLESRSLILCRKAKELLEAQRVDITLVDAKELEVLPYHRGPTPSMEKLTGQIKETDNIIIGVGIYNYTMSDSLKILLDSCFEHAVGKFYGVLVAAGGVKSYLAPMQITQVCQTQYRMIQLPRIVYATENSFKEGRINDSDVEKRLSEFVGEFYKIGEKLLR